MMHFRAAFDDDVRRVRQLQDDYEDGTRILDELTRELREIDARREDVLDDIDDAKDFLKRVDAEIGRYPQEVIDGS